MKDLLFYLYDKLIRYDNLIQSIPEDSTSYLTIHARRKEVIDTICNVELSLGSTYKGRNLLLSYRSGYNSKNRVKISAFVYPRRLEIL